MAFFFPLFFFACRARHVKRRSRTARGATTSSKPSASRTGTSGSSIFARRCGRNKISACDACKPPWFFVLKPVRRHGCWHACPVRCFCDEFAYSGYVCRAGGGEGRGYPPVLAKSCLSLRTETLRRSIVPCGLKLIPLLFSSALCPDRLRFALTVSSLCFFGCISSVPRPFLSFPSSDLSMTNDNQHYLYEN